MSDAAVQIKKESGPGRYSAPHRTVLRFSIKRLSLFVALATDWDWIFGIRTSRDQIVSFALYFSFGPYSLGFWIVRP